MRFDIYVHFKQNLCFLVKINKLQNIDDDKKQILATVNEKRSELENENKTLRVLVDGPTGSGKSSFVDSILSTLCNKIVFEATDMGAACALADSTVSSTEKVSTIPKNCPFYFLKKNCFLSN